MAGRLSRRKIAAYAADKLLSGGAVAPVIKEVAAYLVATRRTRELDLIVRDIEDALAHRGVVVANVATAYPLTDALRKQVATLLSTKTVQLRESVDETLLGGIRVDIPGKRFDGTIRYKLNALKAKQL